MAVTLYVKGDCPHSQRLKTRLESEGTAFRLIDLDQRPQSVTELRKLTAGRRVVPVLVVGGQIEIAPDGGTEF
jgi:glutaredoxin